MKMRSMVFVFVCSISLTGSLIAQSVGAGRNGGIGAGSYTVTGKVLMPDGTPAKTAKVDLSCDFTKLTAYTEDDGTYRMTGVPAGDCTVTARAPGGDPVTEARTIQRDTPSGQAIYIPLFLKGATVINPLLKDVPKPAIDKFKAGVEKLEKGEADAAIALFDQAIAGHSSFAAAWYQKGLAFLKKNDNDKAAESFVKAIDLKSDYVEAKYGFGLAQFQKKNYEVAEAVFRDVIKLKADMYEAHLNLGISLFYLKKTDEAESALKELVTTTGGDRYALSHLYLGQIYIQKAKNADAITELEKYVALLPKAPNAEKIKSVIADLKKKV